MLEPMAGATADEEHVCHARVEVDQEVAVRAVLVLADLRARQLCVAQRRKPAVAKGDDLGKRSVGRPAALGIRIDLHAVGVVRDLHAASLEIGEAVENVAAIEIGPARHRSLHEPAVSGWGGKVKDFLSRREDLGPDYIGEELRKPWPDGEHETIGAEMFAR